MHVACLFRESGKYVNISHKNYFHLTHKGFQSDRKRNLIKTFLLLYEWKWVNLHDDVCEGSQ